MSGNKFDETKLPGSANMLLTDYWKQKVIETLKNIYGENNLKINTVNDFLNKVVEKSIKPTAQFRNIYKEENWTFPLNNILQLVHSNNLIIGANGSFTVNQHVKVNEGSELLIKWLKERADLKKLAIECEEKKDIPGLRKFDNLQTSKKELNNSFYGVSAMNGYILFSPDTASLITSQARELISENLWTLEKLLGSNLCFKTMNEFYSFINEIVNDNIDLSMIGKYSIRVPSFKMLTKRLKEMLFHIPDNEKGDIDNNKSLFLMIKNIEKDPIKSINFYYKYNLYEFFIHNPKVMEIINWIMREKKQFTSSIPSIMKKNESVVYIEPLKELVSVLINFVVLTSPTYDRVDKYINRGRYVVTLSDTDSVITKFQEWIEFCNINGEIKFDTFYDEDDIYRAANSMSFICTEVCNFMGRNMARNCYVPYEYRERINLKNEFFFKSLILYPNIKKNYSAWTTLREGAKVNRISNTGLALEGSNINHYVKKQLKNLIFEEIHSVKNISANRIIKRIYDLEKDMKNKILIERDISFAKFSSYKTDNRVNPYSDSRIRAVALWNHLYPNDKIEFYNKIYIINTILEKENQLYLIKDNEMREFLRDRIFKNPVNKLAIPFGLRTIAIPDTFKQYPKWLVDIIDINNLIEFHLNSFTSLLPSLGIFINRMNSTRNHVSSLIKL